jgi:hypothetical protein
MKNDTMRYELSDCRFINFRNGSFINHFTISKESKDIPFRCERIFYLYDVPEGGSRGAHAHKDCHQLIIAISGSFKVALFDGLTERTVELNSPDVGIHIPPGIWASEVDFASGSLCLVLASMTYDEEDYIRDINDYLLSRQ